MFFWNGWGKTHQLHDTYSQLDPEFRDFSRPVFKGCLDGAFRTVQHKKKSSAYPPIRLPPHEKRSPFSALFLIHVNSIMEYTLED